jgi:hypothetical protein
LYVITAPKLCVPTVLSVLTGGFLNGVSLAVGFLRDVSKKIEETKQIPVMEQPLLYLKMFIAQYQLQMGYDKACKEALESGTETLNNMVDVSPILSARFATC